MTNTDMVQDFKLLSECPNIGLQGNTPLPIFVDMTANSKSTAYMIGIAAGFENMCNSQYSNTYHIYRRNIDYYIIGFLGKLYSAQHLDDLNLENTRSPTIFFNTHSEYVYIAINNANKNGQIYCIKKVDFPIRKNAFTCPDQWVYANKSINVDIYIKHKSVIAYPSEFVRGFADINARIAVEPLSVLLAFNDHMYEVATFIGTHIESKGVAFGNAASGLSLKYINNNAIDFMEILYGDIPVVERDTSLVVPIFDREVNNRIAANAYRPTFQWKKTLPDGIAPSRAHGSDAGYDLTIVKEIKTVNELTTYYDTGIAISPGFGMYTSIVPRSSISKLGYMIQNSPGTIDSSYTGSLIIAVIKTNPSAPPLTLPCRIAQLLFHPVIYPRGTQVESFSDTARGDGGFGSTSSKNCVLPIL